MIRVSVTRKGHDYQKLVCDGHAEYAEPGFDIICAAVSALVANTVNSLEAFTPDEFTSGDREGHVEIVFPHGHSDAAALLMDSLVLGLKNIESDYSKKYLQVKIREV